MYRRVIHSPLLGTISDADRLHISQQTGLERMVERAMASRRRLIVILWRGVTAAALNPYSRDTLNENVRTEDGDGDGDVRSQLASFHQASRSWAGYPTRLASKDGKG